MRAIVGAAMALLLLAPAAQARVGALDLGFGEAGRALTPFNADYRLGSGPVQMAVAPDGSTVLASGSHLARFLPDGHLDAGFGAGGWVALGDVDGLRFEPGSVTVDSQGRVLVFGSTIDPTQTFDPQLMFQPAVPASWATVLRLDAAGHPDPSFGEGKGFVRSDLGLSSDLPIPTVRAGVGTVDSQDRPLFVATGAEVYSPCYGHSGVGWFPKALVRLTAAGGLDAGFDGDGNASLEDVGRDAGLTLTGADEPVVPIQKGGCSGGLVVIRLGADGTPLAGFGTDGVRSYPRAGGLVGIEASGAMILSEGGRPPHLVRVGADGSPDPRFGRDGVATVALPFGGKRVLLPAGIDPQGRILYAGSFVLPRERKHSQGKHRHRAEHRHGQSRRPLAAKRRPPTRSFFAVTRLLRSGRPDTGFGKNGWIVTAFARPTQVFAQDGALDSQGRLLLAGSATSPRLPQGGFVLTRYLLGG
jgi:uncharacterized delta-60 repeat protein